MGVVAIDENGVWRLTALGEAAMARFNGRYHAEPVLCLSGPASGRANEVP